MKEGAVPAAAAILVLFAAAFNLYLTRHSFSGGNNTVLPTFSGETGFDYAAFLPYASAEPAVPGDFLGFVILESSAVLAPSSPLSGALSDRSGLMIYKIKEGDTVSAIAAGFGISLDTIIVANPNLKPSSIKPGQEIVILPVSGVLHQTRDGDTLDSLAAFYNITPQNIVEFNPDLNKKLQTIGSNIIVPGAKAKTGSPVFRSGSGLPNLANYFTIPTTGWNWGQLHSYNAVDIANACGTPVYASAEGLVVEGKSSGWNYGYGQYLKIEHPNQTQTLYSHLSGAKAKVGDYVLQGDLIGYIGNTGNTHGPTGCHLHFEVRGAQNPFAKY